jgi:polysaccharide export outer membrane protein
MKSEWFLFLLWLVACCPYLGGVQGPAQQPVGAGGPAQPVYILSPNDQIVIRAIDIEEISEKPFRIDQDGTINLPLVGRLKAAGMTVEQFEQALTERLKVFVRSPQVAVSVIERSRLIELQQVVFVVGAFRSPGVYPIKGTETVSDIISRAGGLQPNASHRIKLTRRAEAGRIPLTNAYDEQEGKVNSVEIVVNQLMEPINPADNVTLVANDVLNVARVESVYVTGQVMKGGSFGLEDRESLTVTQILALSGGLGPDANPEKALVLRPVMNTARRAEIPLNVKSILEGRANDFPLLPNDVLYVPKSISASRVVGRILLVAIPALITTTIWVVVGNR